MVPRFNGEKAELPPCYPAPAFLNHLRAIGWSPGPVPANVLYTYAHLEHHLAAVPEQYTPNHMLGSGPNTFFLVNATDGAVGVNCLPVGAPAAANQLAMQAELGVRRVLSFGTCGGLQPEMTPGDVVLVTEAVRDEGTSRHFLLSGAAARPDPSLTQQLEAALSDAGWPFASGATWTTDVPFRETAEEIRHYRGHGVLAVEMEAAAVFAAATHFGLEAASVLVVDGVADESCERWTIDLPAAGARLRELFALMLDVLAGPVS